MTVVDAGATGIQLTQTDSYVVGTESYRTDVVVSNAGNAAQSFVVYRAGDCFLQGSDVGFGDLLPDGSVGCHASDDGGLTPGLRIERWIPMTGGSSAYEAGYNAVWAAIGTQNPFPNTCLCTSYIDNGAGLSWSGSSGGGCVGDVLPPHSVLADRRDRPVHHEDRTRPTRYRRAASDSYTDHDQQPDGLRRSP